MHRSLVSRGYTVWIDIEKMQGSTVEAMASAVEGAAVLVYGISSACEYFPPACISLLWYCGTVVLWYCGVVQCNPELFIYPGKYVCFMYIHV